MEPMRRVAVFLGHGPAVGHGCVCALVGMEEGQGHSVRCFFVFILHGWFDFFD
ncbi:MAG: hypothetical protein JWN25_1391 [Verrucomicrobiales bacterium]|nr:hypothetical protein [Verrucomicrobiales bacterium]